MLKIFLHVNMIDYQTILDNTQGSLINSLKFGPQHLDENKLELQMEPPYALE